MIDISPEGVHHFFHHYGNPGIFCLLALGIFGLPVPDETLLVITGLLLAQSHMPLLTTLAAVYSGAICGITLSYIVGRTVGVSLLFRFGSKIGITQTKFEKAHEWCEHYGKWSLIIGYYIPGIRHLFGITAGATNLSYRQFAVFAYTGAFLWASVFLSTGYFFYDGWMHILK